MSTTSTVGAFTDVLAEVSNATATITINRPHKLNAYTPTTLNEIRTVVDWAAENSDIGVVVLAGAGGRAFSSGGDVGFESGTTLDKTATTDPTATFPGAVAALYESFRTCLKPIIAKVDGYAIGGGHHLAYFCDFTIASDRSIFGQNGARVGSPAEGWMVAQLISIIGLRRAKEVWMLCRRYDARTALDWGLVNEVVPAEELDEAVDRWANELLALSPTVLKVLKRTFDVAAEVTRTDVESRNILQEVAPEFFASGEQAEGAAAFLEKRVPEFSVFR